MNQDPDRIEGLQHLARSRAPARDLWPGIQSRLRPRRSRYALGQLALAASLVAALAAMFTFTLPTQDVGRQSFAAGQLTDDSRAIVEANLSLVRSAERELRKALRQDPESRQLRSLLASAETRQRALSAML